MVLYIVRHTKKISEKYFVGKYLKNVVNSRPARHPLSYRGSSEESKVNIYIYFLFYIFIIIIIIILLLSSPLRFGVCAFVRVSVRPYGFVRTITCAIMHGFKNNLAQLLPLVRRSVIRNIFRQV